MKKEQKKVGELLLDAGLIDDFQLNASLAYQKEWGGRLGSIMIKKGFVSEKELALIIAKQYGTPCASLEVMESPSDEILNMVKGDVAKKFGIFPIGLEGKTLLVAVSDPTDLKTLDDISFTLGVRIKPVLALESEITRAIETNYEGKFTRGKFIVEESKTREKTARRVSSGMGSAVIEEKIERLKEAERGGTAPTRSGTEISQKAVIQSIVDLLIAKGVFTREEFMTQLKSKMRQ